MRGRRCLACDGTGAVRTPDAPHGSGIDACGRCVEAAELAWLDRQRAAQLEHEWRVRQTVNVSRAA